MHSLIIPYSASVKDANARFAFVSQLYPTALLHAGHANLPAGLALGLPRRAASGRRPWNDDRHHWQPIPVSAGDE